MSKRTIFACLGLALVGLPTMATAQEEDAEPNLIYGTYFECSPIDKQGVADEIVEHILAPVYDAAVDDGTINSWAWLAHHTGGKWRRLMVFTATGIDNLLAAQGTLGDRIDELESAADGVFGEICANHDDYIWEVASGGGVLTEGEAHFSVYMECAMDREDRADEIIDTVFAPIYNGLVEDGSITSWGWNKHYVGGKWRRLLAMSASDQASVLKARGAAIEALYGADNEAAATEFNSICGAHQDYMWNLQQFKGAPSE